MTNAQEKALRKIDLALAGMPYKNLPPAPPTEVRFTKPDGTEVRFTAGTSRSELRHLRPVVDQAF